MKREDVIFFAPEGGIGIELGIAEGEFASRVCEKGHMYKWYGVDAYRGDRGHNKVEMHRMLERMSEYEAFEFIQATFDEVVKGFADEYFDIVYVDGYAHTGQERGSTIEQWYPKVKTGGIIAGDDYCKTWPLNMKMIDQFIGKYGLELKTIGEGENTRWSKSPTWYAIKK